MLVVGGGPAGSALALLLAQRARDVALVDRGRAHHSGPHETLLASSLPMLERAGLGRLVRDCAQVDSMRHGAIWGGDELVWQAPGEAGLWLQRGPFDEALRTAAAARGARVGCPGRVRLRPGGGEAELDLAGAGAELLRPAHVVIATGRGPLPATVGAHEAAAGPRTFAFTFVGEPAAGDRGTAVVEAVPEGWIWTHAPAAGGASAAVLLDGAQLHEVGREVLLARAFAHARGPAQRLRDRRLRHANDATARLRTTAADVLLLGDAAATIDPLASQGVEKALAAAEQAAAVLDTALDRPDWWPRLRLLHARWEQGLFNAHRAASAAFVQLERRFTAEPFWRRRQPPSAPRPALAPGTPLVRAASVQDGSILVRHGDGFVEAEGACDTATGETLSHVGYVPVLPLLATFAVPRALADAVTAAGRDARLFVLPPRAVHEAMLELHRRGWLTAAAGAAGSP